VGDRQSTTRRSFALPFSLDLNRLPEEKEAVEEDQLHFRRSGLKMTARCSNGALSPFRTLPPRPALRLDRAKRLQQPRKQFMSSIIDAIEKEQLKTDVTNFKVGDGVRVHTRVVEGDKERIQIFAGIVIGRKGRGMNETFTVRRISYGEGVERVFPLHSPRIAKVEVEKQGRARRAKLNYLRDRKGKEATAVREEK
jgi:large subunit ribosomal protein L19